MRLYQKGGKASTTIALDVEINHMLECSSLSQLNSLALHVFLLSTFSLFCLLSLPFRKWHCVRVQIPPCTRISGWPEVYEDCYIWECWPSKETFRWWCLIFLVGGGNLFSPSIFCSNLLASLRNTSALSAFLTVHY